jgi:hypothetical protein
LKALQRVTRLGIGLQSVGRIDKGLVILLEPPAEIHQDAVPAQNSRSAHFSIVKANQFISLGHPGESLVISRLPSG